MKVTLLRLSLDVDECLDPQVHGCQHTCVNTLGTVVITVRVILDTLLILMKELALVNCTQKYCNKVYYLKYLADPCAYQLAQPVDGTISCTGVSTDDNCTFDCDPGFSLFGESVITCLPNNQWSAPQTISGVLHNQCVQG